VIFRERRRLHFERNGVEKSLTVHALMSFAFINFPRELTGWKLVLLPVLQVRDLRISYHGYMPLKEWTFETLKTQG